MLLCLVVVYSLIMQRYFQFFYGVPFYLYFNHGYFASFKWSVFKFDIAYYYGTNDLVNCRSFDRVLNFQQISHAVQINLIIKFVVPENRYSGP